MNKTEDIINKQRVRSSNLTVVVSIALVLFFIGLIFVISMNTNTYVKNVKEQMTMEVYFKNDVKPALGLSSDSLNFNVDVESEHMALKDSLEKLNYVRSVKYVSKQEASSIAKEELGIDSDNLFNADIYPASLVVSLKSEYVKQKNMETLKESILENHNVDEVSTAGNEIKAMNKDLQRLTLGLSILTIIIFVSSIILINNSIRLKIQTNKFLIRTMQLVGAQKFFIIKPFLKEALYMGVAGAIVSLAILFGLEFLLVQYEIATLLTFSQHLLLSLGILVLGIVITVASTFLTTMRLITLRLDDLYKS